MNNFVLILIFAVSSCNTNTQVKKTVCERSKLSNDVPLTREVKINECFKKQFIDENISGGTFIVNTLKGNFYKYNSISDTEFVFSCGKDEKEISLRKYNCKTANRLPQLVYEDYGILVFREMAGSDSWLDEFVDLLNDTVYSTQSYFIDTLHLRYVDMVYSNKEHSNVNFLVHHVKERFTDTLKANYNKFRKDGDPFLNVSNISLDDKYLYYFIKKADTYRKDSIDLYTIH